MRYDAELMKQVLKKYPLLGVYGFSRLSDQSEFESPMVREAFEYCCGWLENKKRIKSLWYSSYSLKHLIEEDYGKYVPNGVAICAIIAVGWPIRRVQGSKNVEIGFSKKNLKKG